MVKIARKLSQHPVRGINLHNGSLETDLFSKLQKDILDAMSMIDEERTDLDFLINNVTIRDFEMQAFIIKSRF